jgi:hypothetical protein
MTDQNKDQFSLNLEKTSKSEKPDEQIKESDKDSLEWICHPAKRNLKITTLVTVFLIILVVLVYWMTASAWFTILAILILFGSLASFYFPTRYKFTPDEIIIKTSTQKLTKNWSQYRTFYPDKNGVLLSPFARKTRMENFRGIYIKFEGNKDEVVDYVQKHINPTNADTESGGE